MTMTRADQNRAFLKQWIKDYCDTNGLTYAEAKAAAQKLIDEEAERTAMTEPQKLAHINEYVAAHLVSNGGKRFIAVKKARELFGIGLREAVEFVDSNVAAGRITL